jgi:pilus assembly protein CpaC
MHRTNCVQHALLGSFLVLGLVVGEASPARAADPPAAAAPKLSTIVVGVGTTKPVPITAGKIPVDYKNDKEGVVRLIRPEDVKESAKVTGLVPGIAHIDITYDDKSTERVEVIVQTDIELLQTLLRRTVPTAAVTPVPGGGSSIILTGTVAHAEDIDTVLSVARSFTIGAAGGAAVQIINALHVGGVQQVQLDVVVAAVSRSQLRQLGVSFLQQGTQHILSSTIAGNLSVPSGGFQSSGGSLTITNQASSPTVFLGMFNQSQQLFTFLNALRTNSLTKLLAEPKLVTMSGRPATFLSGGDQAVPEVSGFGGTAGVRFEPFGTRLSFLPLVLGNGKIYLEVTPEISQLSNAAGVTLPSGGTAFTVPGRVTQRVNTSVMMEDGQTFVIGGLIQNTVQASITKIPVIGDLPFIGSFFNQKSYNEEEDELLIMVTPHLVDPLDCGQSPKVVPGQETRAPDDFELFLENILEAPRGLREVCHDRVYVPAWKNSTTAGQFPCGGGHNNTPNGIGHGGLGGVGGSAGCSCNSSASAPMAAPAAPVVSGMPSASLSVSPPEPIQPTGGVVVPAPVPMVPDQLPAMMPGGDGSR